MIIAIFAANFKRTFIMKEKKKKERKKEMQSMQRKQKHKSAGFFFLTPTTKSCNLGETSDNSKL